MIKRGNRLRNAWIPVGISLACWLAGAQAAGPQPLPLPKPGVPQVAPLSLPPLPTGGSSGNSGKRLADEMDCLLEPRFIANVGSPVEGTLAEVTVDRGASVTKGQLLARLNSKVDAANLELRKAQAEYGQRKVLRNEELFKKELISISDKDELETQTRIAKLEMEQQRQVLEQRSILSPFDGVVVERFLGPGERVANEKILKLAQIDPLNVEVVVPVELFGQIKNGMTADVRLTPLLSGQFKARVSVVDRVIDASSGTFGVRLELPNPDHRIPAGIKCRVRFQPGSH